jgi:ribosome biogenesis protein MAK21
MQAELQALAAAARSAAPRIHGGANISVNTTKETHPPRKKKEKKKKERKEKSNKKQKDKDKKIASSGGGGNRPRRASFDAASSSYGRLELQKPPPAATAKPKFQGKKITFGEPEETTDKYDGEDGDEKNSSSNTTQGHHQSSALDGQVGLTNKESSFWFDNTPPSLVEGQYKAKMSFDAGKKLENEAEVLWNLEVEAYAKRKERGGKSSSDGKWLRTVMRNGTLSDRVAAMSMVVQESALHNFSTLSALVAMTKKRGSREAHLAIEAVRDLFASYLLPGNRKLQLFHNHPLDHSGVTPTYLVWWKFESALSNKYGEFISALEEGAQESLPYFKRACIQAMQELLSKKPEQEKRLLSLLVNKLGDPDRKIGANVVFMLQQIIREHPGMKISIVKELEALMFRDHVAKRAQYYSLVFMTEIPLERGHDQSLAKEMIRLYIQMFASVVEETQFRDEDNDELAKQKKKKKARWGENGPSRSTQSKKKGSFRDKRRKKNVSVAKEAIGDQRTKLIRALLQGLNRAFPYADATGDETSEMTDALFRIVHGSPFATGVQALMLLLHVMVARDVLSDRFYRTLYQKLFDPDLRRTHKYTMFLNVVYKSMKMDDEPTRVLAYAKRLLQVCVSTTNASFTCGVLFLISEVGKTQERLKSHLCDRDVERPTNNPSSGVGGVVGGVGGEIETQKQLRYDAEKRDPTHAKAETTSLWELSMLERHYHPSVRSFATSLMNESTGNKIVYTGDPLLDFSTSAFLERFSYRNPKQKDLASIRRESGRGGGGSVMAPIAPGKYGRTSVANPVNSKDFALQSGKSVRPDERFFLNYFRTKGMRNQRLETPQEETDEDDLEEVKKMNEMEQRNPDKLYGNDSEEEAYAQELAEQMMAEHAANGAGPDDDEEPVFDWSDDNNDDDGDDDNGDDDPDGFLMDDDDDEDDEMFEDMQEMEDSDEDGDDDEEEEDEARQGSKRAAGANTRKGTFAEAEEFAEILESSGKADARKNHLDW